MNDTEHADPLPKVQRFNRYKLPVIQQSEAAECGIACIAMILNYHGYKIDLMSIRFTHELTLNGCSLADLIDISDGYQLDSRALQLELNELHLLRTPCILHWDLNHFVVLKKASKHKIVIHDPAIGARTLSMSQASKHFTGIALELIPKMNFEKKQESKTIKISTLFNNFPGLKSNLFQLLLLAIILQFFSVISPLYIQWITDDVIANRNTQLLNTLCFGFTLLLFLQILINYLRTHISIFLSTRLSFDIGSNVLDHLLKLPMRYFEKRHMGDLLERFQSLSPIQSFIQDDLINIVLGIFLSVAMCTMMLLYSVKLSIIIFISLFLYSILRMMSYFTFKQANQDMIIADAKQSSYFMETIRAIQTIKLFSKEQMRKSIWLNQLSTVMNLGIRIERISWFYGVANTLIFGIENILILYLGATFIIEGSLTLGVLLAFTSYKSQFTGATTGLIDQFVQYKMLSIHLERLSDILLTEKDTVFDDNKTFSLNPHAQGQLSIKNLSYRHHKTYPFLFQNVSFETAPGESIAITGISGSGKTTLMKLLVGLLPSETGDIAFDGSSLNIIGHKYYRHHIATVMQDDQLLTGSLLENICFFDHTPNLDKVHHCIELAAMAEDIQNMPMGLNSLIGDMGSALSGGQKQRILLARALYKEPKIIFLDEATSNLDVEREEYVNRQLKSLNITKIFISHREETINMADRVFVLENGLLIEQGKQI